MLFSHQSSLAFLQPQIFRCTFRPASHLLMMNWLMEWILGDLRLDRFTLAVWGAGFHTGGLGGWVSHRRPGGLGHTGDL